MGEQSATGTARIRFLLDEHVDVGVAEGLRGKGIDVVTAQEVGLRRTPDSEILRFAGVHGRVVVTADAHYFDLQYSQQPHAGIAYCGRRVRETGQVVLALEALFKKKWALDMQNWLEFLKPVE
jgi:predicted nuclease of predicted toxin-antitoxin system